MAFGPFDAQVRLVLIELRRMTYDRMRIAAKSIEPGIAWAHLRPMRTEQWYTLIRPTEWNAATEAARESLKWARQREAPSMWRQYRTDATDYAASVAVQAVVVRDHLKKQEFDRQTGPLRAAGINFPDLAPEYY